MRRLKATQDAEEIANQIAKDSLEAAIRFLEQTEATLKHLAEFPSIGSPFPSDRTDLARLRTCRVREFPRHVIFYLEHDNAIEVVRILHGARDIEAELWRT